MWQKRPFKYLKISLCQFYVGQMPNSQRTRGAAFCVKQSTDSTYSKTIKGRPKQVSFEVMNRKHDYNANPSPPLGCAVEIHAVPSQQRTWEAHTKTGFYLGNSWEHYRYHEIWIVDIYSIRVGQAVFFKHKYMTQLSVTTPLILCCVLQMMYVKC